MSGVYIHIPFCKQRCTYCNFYSTTLTNILDKYINSVCEEAIVKSSFLSDRTIGTVYIGGGTPSLLNFTQINKIYETLTSVYDLTQLKEFTIECNPDDINESFISGLKKTLVNRVSIGIQSFDDTILKFINRRHNSLAAIKAVKMLKHCGYKNISIDLIYGIPRQSWQSWTESVEQAIELDVQHISAYNLSFEEGTQMMKFADEAPDDETCLKMYKHLCSRLNDAGFEHYEISNFAKEGFRSIHNSSYWTRIPYIGLGAGAHSFNTTERHWNTGIKIYGKNIKWETEKETLSERDIFNELILTSLRTKEGLSIEKIDKKYLSHFQKTAEKHFSNGLLEKRDNCIKLTPYGIFMSDLVIRDFIVV